MMRRTILQRHSSRSVKALSHSKPSLRHVSTHTTNTSSPKYFLHKPQTSNFLIPSSSFSSFNNGYPPPPGQEPRNTFNNGSFSTFNQGYPPPPGQEPRNTEQTQTQDKSIELGDDVVAAVSQFKGVVLLHIRRYYYNKTKQRIPGKEGITLRTSHVNKLEEYFDDIDGDLQRLYGEVGQLSARSSMELGSNRHVEVIVRDSFPEVAFFQNGENVQQNRCIALNMDQYKSLKHYMPVLKQYISELSGAVATSSTALELDLGPFVKARVIKFSTGYFVDLRRSFPAKDGQSQPAKVGIALHPDQWRILEGNYQAVHDALYRGDLRYSLELNPLRKVTLSWFKQAWNVAIREYYRDPTTAELKFGRRGINLSVEEWNELYNAIPQLSETLRNCLANSANEAPSLQTEYFPEHAEQ